MKFSSESNHKITSTQLFIPLSLGLALGTLGDTILYVALPQEKILLQTGLTTGAVGLILGLNRLARLLTNHPVGTLYCYLPRRKIMIPAAFLGVIASVCYALSTNITLMIAGRIIWGLAWSGLWIGATTMTLDISTDENRGKMSGILAFTTTIGLTICSLTAGVLCDWLGFHLAMWFTVFACSLNVIVWLFFLPETITSFRSKKNQSLLPQTQSAMNTRSLFKISGFIGIPLFAQNFVYNGVIVSTTVLWLERFLGDGVKLFHTFVPIVTLAGIYSAFRILIGATSGPIAGAFTDRTGNRKTALVIMLIFGACTTFLLGLSIPILAFTGAILGSIATGAISTLVYAWAGDRFQSESARAIGMINSMGDLGSALGPIIALNLIPLFGLPKVYSSLGLIFIAAILSILKV